MGLLTSKTGRFEDRIEDHPNMIQVLAEGDSWFAIRDLKNILRQLKKYDKLNILSLSNSGDEAIEMMSWEQKKKIHDLLEDKQQQYNFRLLLYSAGGNDVVGPEMWHVLNEYDSTMTTPDKCINSKMWGIKKTLIEMTYCELIEIRNNLKPNLNIVTHTYDQAIPSGKAHTRWIFKFAGPWMKPSMVKRSIPEHLHQGIVDILLGDMRQTLLDIQSTENNFYVVDTWGELNRTPDLWFDELHPTNIGFEKIVKNAWKPVLEEVLGEAI